ncbi:MAG: ferritin-like domain-containing protein [Candidatus Lokiarchaeota archaeon]|nr:ferritin-like domain-containing protein [Candidatus Lokiarchaeota archaeon]
MGTIGRKIVGMDLNELIDLLNEALADEWLAVYQYWVGAKIAEGRMRPNIVKELEEHQNDELKHANMLADRIVQLGGTPLLHPKDLLEKSGCGYKTPSNSNTVELLKQNIEGEQCAIMAYKKILDKIIGKDSITMNMIRKIMEDEVEHEQDLEDLLNDINLSK